MTRIFVSQRFAAGGDRLTLLCRHLAVGALPTQRPAIRRARLRSLYSGSSSHGIAVAPSVVANSIPTRPPSGVGMTTTLERPSDQHVTARLAGAGSLRDELAAVFDAAPPNATTADFRRLILEENAAGKRSGSARMWAWKRLKLRYALDSTETVEFQAFRSAYGSASSAAERGLVVGLMLARTDRLFREMTLDHVSPLL